MWDGLPMDITLRVIQLRNSSIRSERAAQRVQSRWKGYRTRVLLGRFHMLEYLHVFRQFNPSVRIFLHRARL